ncbi:MAG: hypothetical protein ACYC6V_09120, partial [Bacillota bacterium]
MRRNRTKRKKGTGQSVKSSKSWFSLDRWRDFVTNRGQGVSVFRATALVALVLVVLIGLSGFGFVAASLRGLPSLADIGPNPDLSTLVYDDQNQLVGQIHGV